MGDIDVRIETETGQIYARIGAVEGRFVRGSNGKLRWRSVSPGEVSKPLLNRARRQAYAIVSTGSRKSIRIREKSKTVVHEPKQLELF